MKPIGLEQNIFDGPPLAEPIANASRFMRDGIGMAERVLKTAHIGGEHELDHHGPEEHLGKRGFETLNELRNLFGAKMHDGITIRPTISGSHTLEMEALTDDTNERHQTNGILSITSRTGQKTTFLFGASQPTKAGTRDIASERWGFPMHDAWVLISDPDPESETPTYKFSDYSPAEQIGLSDAANTALDEFDAALASGKYQVAATMKPEEIIR